MTKARDIASAAPAPSTVSATEIGYLDGVSSAIQTQLDNKQAVVANVNDTEIGYLDGVTSAIQTQIDGKSSTSHNHDSTYVAKSLVDAKGDLLVGSANDTVSRLAVASTAGYVLTVDSAEATGLKWAAAGASFVGVSASNGSITTSGGGNTNITFDTETYDTDNFHSTSSSTQNFTIPTGKSGKYLFTLTLFWNTGSGIREVYVRKNSSPFRRYDQYTPNGTNSQVIAEVYNLSAGDVIFSEVYNVSTNTLINAFCQFTYLGA